MIVGKNGRPIIRPEDYLACPFCKAQQFMVIPLSRIVLSAGKVGIIPSDESVVYCHQTFKLIPPEYFTTGKLPIITTPAGPPPAGKEPPECGPGPSSSESPPSSPPSSS